MIGLLPFNIKDVEVIEIAVEKLLLLVPKKFMNGIFLSDWKIEQFKDYPFLMVGKNNRFRDKVDEYLYENNTIPNILIESENIETLLDLCIEEMGITFYNSLFIKQKLHSLRSIYEEKISILDLNDIRTDMVAIGYYKHRYLTFAAKEFIRIAKERFSNTL